MIYQREKRYGVKGTLNAENIKEESTEKEEVVEETPQEVDLESMEFFKLRAYAIEQGVDVQKHRTKKDILTQLGR